MALTYPISNNIVVPAGRCLFAVETSSTTEGTAYTYLGDNPSFTISGAAETTVILSSDDVVATELVNIPKSVTRSASMTLRNISTYNLSLFAMGAEATTTQTTGTGTTAITMAKGRYYKIGGDDVQDITVGTGGVHQGATVSGAAIAASGGKNWEVDLTRGIIYFPTGTAATTGAITVAYSKTATTWKKVSTGSTPVYGSLLFLSNNTAGSDYTIKISRCSLAPNGDANFKGRDNAVELGFTIGIMLRGTTAAITVNGAPA
jgi:hypothetical protein